MGDLTKVYVCCDDSSHWYVIPLDKKELFIKLSNLSYENDDWEEFEKEFNRYRIGGSINNIQLWANLK